MQFEEFTLVAMFCFKYLLLTRSREKLRTQSLLTLQSLAMFYFSLFSIHRLLVTDNCTTGHVAVLGKVWLQSVALGPNGE